MRECAKLSHALRRRPVPGSGLGSEVQADHPYGRTEVAAMMKASSVGCSFLRPGDLMSKAIVYLEGA